MTEESKGLRSASAPTDDDRVARFFRDSLYEKETADELRTLLREVRADERRRASAPTSGAERALQEAAYRYERAYDGAGTAQDAIQALCDAAEGFAKGIAPVSSSKAPLCGKYLGDNDGTCPQLTCIRARHHDGDCDNVRGDEPRTGSASPCDGCQRVNEAYADIFDGARDAITHLRKGEHSMAEHTLMRAMALRIRPEVSPCAPPAFEHCKGCLATPLDAWQCPSRGCKMLDETHDRPAVRAVPNAGLTGQALSEWEADEQRYAVVKARAAGSSGLDPLQANAAVIRAARDVVEAEMRERRETHPGTSGAKRAELSAAVSYRIDCLDKALVVGQFTRPAGGDK